MKRLVGSMIVISAFLVALGWFLLPQTGFLMSQAGPGGNDELVLADKERDAFAADRADGNLAVRFDADRAMGYLKDICRIGPRISGSEGMKQQQEMLRKHFEDLGGKVALQKFQAQQKSQPRPTEMANLIVSWHPERKKRVILCSHYDTRPLADQEPDPRKWRLPFVSANDGGSGVALLMELAHHMKDLKTEVGVDFVFFDGEEYIFNPRDERDGGDLYFFGSKHFAEEYRRKKPEHRYQAAVLLDMVAGKNPRFLVEQNSWIKAGPLVQDLWNIAAHLRCSAFQNRLGDPIRDDHVALNQAGIPAVDILDYNYMNAGHWHRLSDTPENCSGETLDQVARVLVFWLQAVK